MHLGALLYPTGYHLAAWRHPNALADAGVNFAHYRNLVEAAEAAALDFVFLADSVGIRGGDYDMLSRGAHNYVGQFEPLSLISALGAVTHRIGLVASASTTYHHPYHVARIFASVDHITGGRGGWNLVTSHNAFEACNFGPVDHPSHAQRYGRAREFAEVVNGLWDSWEPDAFVADKVSGRFFDPSKVKTLDHVGDHFCVKGPLNVPRSPQGRPVLVQAGSSTAGKDLGAETADVVFTAQDSLSDAREFYRDIKSRLARFNRTPDQVKVLVGVLPYVAESREKAERKVDELQRLVDPVVGMALLSQKLGGVDLSNYSVDEPLPELPETEGHKSRQQLLVDYARREGLTIRGLYEHFTAARGHHHIVGTPGEVADDMEEWVTTGAADGFIIMAPMLADGLIDFLTLVVPELCARGLFRSEYAGSTLRQHLGLRQDRGR